MIKCFNTPSGMVSNLMNFLSEEIIFEFDDSYVQDEAFTGSATFTGLFIEN